MSNPNKEIPEEMTVYSEELAARTLATMRDEEALDYVRGFCQAMVEWQPNLEEHLVDPVTLGLQCLTLAELFKLSFTKGYEYAAARIDAADAIKKALGEDS